MVALGQLLAALGLLFARLGQPWPAPGPSSAALGPLLAPLGSLLVAVDTLVVALGPLFVRARGPKRSGATPAGVSERTRAQPRPTAPTQTRAGVRWGAAPLLSIYRNKGLVLLYLSIYLSIY